MLMILISPKRRRIIVGSDSLELGITNLELRIYRTCSSCSIIIYTYG